MYPRASRYLAHEASRLFEQRFVSPASIQSDKHLLDALQEPGFLCHHRRLRSPFRSQISGKALEAAVGGGRQRASWRSLAGAAARIDALMG